jgi:hypothetical protein
MQVQTAQDKLKEICNIVVRQTTLYHGCRMVKNEQLTKMT